MPVFIVVPRFDSNLCSFWLKIIEQLANKSRNYVLFAKVLFFLEKKAPGRAAPNRRPSWGCTKTPISIKTHWKSTKIKKSTPRQPSLFLSLRNEFTTIEQTNNLLYASRKHKTRGWLNQPPIEVRRPCHVKRMMFWFLVKRQMMKIWSLMPDIR